MESVNKKKRSSNFTTNDKCLLINIVSKYKNIVENKKTDAVTTKEKNEAWEKIGQDFNSSGPSCPRDVECLKRCYDNRKKLLRKSVAFQTREMYKTGGGLPDVKTQKEPGDDLLLSIVCNKTVSGLKNQFDGDAMQHTSNNLSQPESHISVTSNQHYYDNIEIVYESDEEDNRISSMEVQEMPEEKYNTPDRILKEKKHNESDQPLKNWERYKIDDLKSRTSIELKSCETPTLAPNVSAEPGLSRRRPRTIVKSLTTSELSQKYNRLLDERLDIAHYQKQHLQNQIKMETREHELRVELLKTQIEKEKSATV